MKRAAILLTLTVAAAVAAGASSAFSSEETDLAQLKKEIAKIAAGQQAILDELKSIREELYIVKIRCSS